MQEQLTYEEMSAKMGGYAQRMKELIYEAAKDGINLALLPKQTVNGVGVATDEYLTGRYVSVKQHYQIPLTISRPLANAEQIRLDIPCYLANREDDINMLDLFESPAIAVVATALRACDGPADSEVTYWYKPHVWEEPTKPTAVTHNGFPIVPIINQENKGFFIDPHVVVPVEVLVENERFFTSPLAFGKRFDLLALSASDSLFNKGVQDSTDCIDPNVSLKNLYVNIHGRVFKINVEQRALTNAAFALQGDYRDMWVNFTSILEIDTNTPVVSELKLNGNFKGKVHISVEVTGVVNLQFGTVELHSKAALKGFDNTVETDPAFVDMHHTSISLIGYDLNAYRVNPNRRPR